jgi:glycosyltransferase involved in cell wall biosynthesis
MDQPLISIAMATYNGQLFLEEQLESIIAQTYHKIELVITDDCSADNTVSILKKYQKQYPFIRILINGKNLGVTKTFENSVKNCKGDYIALSDQDDIWELNKIETLYKNIGTADAIYANSLLVNEKAHSMGTKFGDLMNLKSYYSGAPFLMGNCVPGHAMLLTAKFAFSVLPFPDNMLFDRWLSFCAASGNGIKYVDEVLVKYRQHANNAIGTGKIKNKKNLLKPDLFVQKLAELKILQQAPIYNHETKTILNEMIEYFHKGWRVKRSRFFFKNFDKILVIKKKSKSRRMLYCFKMFFKPNY